MRWIAALLFSLAAAVTFAEVFRSGPADAVAVQRMQGSFWIDITRADAQFQAWLVERNARTLLTRPHHLFDAEHCAPAEGTLAFGIPMVTQGLLAIPATLVSDEPVWIFNFSIVVLTLLGAFAMYALIARWTGSASAGVVAGLLFGFQPMRLAHISYPSVWDISWTVLAIFFAERLFSSGRWRDAIGLAAAISLQIGASFYPLLAATLLAPPLVLWLWLRHGLRNVNVRQLALVAVATLLTAAAILGPYLSAETATGPFKRTEFQYLSWSLFTQADKGTFPGWTVLVLATVALLVGRRRAAPGTGGDPRWALVVGAIFVALVAAGSNNQALLAEITPSWLASRMPNPHAVLASIVPGLDAVRGIHRVAAGLYLALIVLAGLGAGVLIRAAGTRGRLVAVALVGVTAFDVLRIPAMGIDRPYHWTIERIRPADPEIAFFEELQRLGNTGPMLELPSLSLSGPAERILLSAYHHRRTSACFGSYQPADREALKELASELPQTRAVDELVGLGFTTVVVHRGAPGPRSKRLLAALDRAAEQNPQIEHLHTTPLLSAYALRPQTQPPLRQEPGPR